MESAVIESNPHKTLYFWLWVKSSPVRSICSRQYRCSHPIGILDLVVLAGLVAVRQESHAKMVVKKSDALVNLVRIPWIEILWTAFCSQERSSVIYLIFIHADILDELRYHWGAKAMESYRTLYIALYKLATLWNIVTEALEISDLVRELRQRLGLTQEQFAAKLGVTFATVNRWENRRAKPSRIATKLIEAEVRRIGESSQDLLNKYFSS